MIKAFIFDFDGTLFDTSEANVAAYRKAFIKAGVTFDENGYRAAFGLRFKEMINRIAPDASSAQHAQIRELKVKFYKESFSLIKQNSGLVEFAKSSKGKFLTSLVTTASRTNTHSLLTHFEVPLNTFNVIVVGEDVNHSKPDPECYIIAMSQLGVEPSECCIFEDSEFGIAAAQKTGAHVVKVVL